SVSATVNGVPTAVSPSFDRPQDGPPGSSILRVTQLGLNLTSNGAKICITLKPNSAGQGCTTLEQLCVPPNGMAPGSCIAAMFDYSLDCCPITRCQPTKVSVCGSFVSEEEARKLEPWAALQSPLWATNINWSSSAAQGGEICIELKNTTTLSQLCLGDRPNTAWISLFNKNRKCCPTYTAAV
ncbi:extracellular matrix glycoprotein pherophorin-V37, partial [Volvox carteri f. nagariensis]